MLNPSTATEHEDDPTIRRCVDFARRWGYGSLEVGNLFDVRSTDPSFLYHFSDRVSPANDNVLIGIVQRAACVVAAWGVHGKLGGRGRQVLNLLGNWKEIHCLGLTAEGQPRHPLYVPAITERSILVQGPMREVVS
jgi:hypothetical protein